MIVVLPGKSVRDRTHRSDTPARARPSSHHVIKPSWARVRSIVLKLDLTDANRLLGLFQAEGERFPLLVLTAVVGEHLNLDSHPSLGPTPPLVYNATYVPLH